MSESKRRCGDCQLCCKLMPMSAGRHSRERIGELVQEMAARGLIGDDELVITEDFDKPAGERCPFQKHGKGCTIYARRPFGCRFWQCVWLANEDAEGMSRPDHAHYVVDTAPDFVRGDDGTDNIDVAIPVIQVWVDPRYPHAHRDPALRRYLERRAKDGFAALVRYSATEGIFLVPPSMSKNGVWVEVDRCNNVGERPHTAEEVAAAIGTVPPLMVWQGGSNE